MHTLCLASLWVAATLLSSLVLVEPAVFSLRQQYTTFLFLSLLLLGGIFCATLTTLTLRHSPLGHRVYQCEVMRQCSQFVPSTTVSGRPVPTSS